MQNGTITDILSIDMDNPHSDLHKPQLFYHRTTGGLPEKCGVGVRLVIPYDLNNYTIVLIGREYGDSNTPCIWLNHLIRTDSSIWWVGWKKL